jgi:hypothetical protein
MAPCCQQGRRKGGAGYRVGSQGGHPKEPVGVLFDTSPRASAYRPNFLKWPLEQRAEGKGKRHEAAREWYLLP